jgi:hypothetical protein
MNDTQKKIQEELAKLSNSKFANLTDNQLSDIESRYGKERPEHSEKLKGRSRKDQSKRMSGDNNIMAGKVSPNRGKEMPQISAKIKGKAKPEGFGEKISKARKGVPNLKALGVARPDHSETMKDPSRNKGAAYMRETITCPHCGKSANGPNYKRWHGDNCKVKK